MYLWATTMPFEISLTTTPASPVGRRRVIVDGVQKIGPGLKVHPVPVADSTTAQVKPKPGGPAK